MSKDARKRTPSQILGDPSPEAIALEIVSRLEQGRKTTARDLALLRERLEIPNKRDRTKAPAYLDFIKQLKANDSAAIRYWVKRDYDILRAEPMNRESAITILADRWCCDNRTISRLLTETSRI